MTIFDGYAFAAKREPKLKSQVEQLRQKGKELKIAAILFIEDQGSVLYTRLKKEAAQRVGIVYEVFEFSLKDSTHTVLAKLAELNQDETVTGIIIQKPYRSLFNEVLEIQGSEKFNAWWHKLTSLIKPEKDIDGLHPDKRPVLPATARGILAILESELSTVFASQETRYLILNRSDILGKPLFTELQKQGKQVEIWGSKEFKESQERLGDFDVIITATGRKHLITGKNLKDGVVLIDAAEPEPDVDRNSVKGVASFLTPVPGGVGPVTVVSLLQNAVFLAFES